MKLLSTFLIVVGLVILLFIFGPVVKEEIKYQSNQWEGIRYTLDLNLQEPNPVGVRLIAPVNTEFGVVIPKINVNAQIFPEIDPTNPSEYLPILKMGVAHAKNSAYPDKEGNVFLFAHSTDAFYNVAHYNAVFFLIGKLDKGDEVDIFYNNKRYKYEVYKKGVVSPQLLGDYIKGNTSGKSLTLQTCYPPGTTINRLVVLAKQSEQ
jgi:sortase A